MYQKALAKFCPLGILIWILDYDLPCLYQGFSKVRLESSDFSSQLVYLSMDDLIFDDGDVPSQSQYKSYQCECEIIES